MIAQQAFHRSQLDLVGHGGPGSLAGAPSLFALLRNALALCFALTLGFEPSLRRQVRASDFCARYGVGLDVSANCVVIKGKRGGEVRYAACMVLATTRADVNGVVRRRLDARTASFAPMDEAVALTGMEYGGITPLGLPADWPILIDAAVARADEVVIGSGIRASKLFLPGAVLAALPNAEVIDGLARPVA